MRYHKHNYRNVTKTQLNNTIEEYVIGFKSYRNKEILKSRLIEGLTFEELAEKFDMSVRQVKKIVYDYELIITNHLRVEE